MGNVFVYKSQSTYMVAFCQASNVFVLETSNEILSAIRLHIMSHGTDRSQFQTLPRDTTSSHQILAVLNRQKTRTCEAAEHFCASRKWVGDLRRIFGPPAVIRSTADMPPVRLSPSSFVV